MDSRLAARLERLRVLSQHDLAALHDRPPSPVPDVDDEPAPGGGVSLVPAVTAPESSEDAQSLTEEAPSKTCEQPFLAEAKMKHEPPPTTSGQADTERRFIWVQGTESSHNLGSNPKLSPLPATSSKLPPTHLQRSELAHLHEKYFTPIVALSKYPYKFCNKNFMQDIASAFFDQGKFWTREWDLYYLWDIEESKPLILVRESQVQDLLQEINSHFKLGLKITDSQREEGLILRFPDHPRCRPRYLGRSYTRDEYNSMTDEVPPAGVRPSGEPALPPLNVQTLNDFKQMIEEAWEVQKSKSKASNEKKRVNRLKKQKVFTDQFKRAQRYLGLRPTDSQGTSAPGAIPAVDVSLSAPFPCDRSVVFICVDVEAYEKDHQKITEVGIATLDTRDLLDIAPGKDGENWRSKIQARHFRIAEYTHLVNSEYVSGCPGSFFFGQSEFVSLKGAPTFVASCFESPFCAESGPAPQADNFGCGEKRNIIFLGHDALTDVKYLQNLGFDPLGLPNLLEAQDTANLFRMWRREEQNTKLGTILARFNIDQFGLHNAGNDAVYTVQIFLAICVREASIRNSPELQQVWDDQKKSRIAFEQQELKQNIERDAKGWEVLDADGDGGGPVPIVIKRSTIPDTIPRTRTSDTPASNNVGDRERGGRRGDVNGTDFQSGRGHSNIECNSHARGRVRTQGPPVSGTFVRYEGSSTAPHDGFAASEHQVEATDGWGGTAAW